MERRTTGLLKSILAEYLWDLWDRDIPVSDMAGTFMVLKNILEWHESQDPTPMPHPDSQQKTGIDWRISNLADVIPSGPYGQAQHVTISDKKR